MRIYSARSTVGLLQTDEQSVAEIPGRVLEDAGSAEECFVMQLLERLKEQTVANQALEKELLAYRKREARLRKNLVNYRLLAESTPAFIYIHKGNRIYLINPCSHAFAGYTAEEIRKIDFQQVIHPDFQEIVRERCEAYHRGEVSAAIFSVMVISKAGQERWVEVETKSIAYEGQPAVLVVARDISERKRAEAALLTSLKEKEAELQVQASLLQAQKMEMVGQLAGGMAHELNNQLTVIYACVDLYLARLSKDNPLRRALLKIRNSAQVSANLTRQMLLFGRKSPLFKIPLDLNRNLEELGEMLPRLVGEEIAIRLDTCPDLWPVNADASNIEQVIINLAINARDAMPEGGAITIETKNVYMEHPGQSGHAPRFVCLSVADTGAGIDEADLTHIFEPFFTTKEQGEGAGLGLSVAYGIIQAHNGWIEVDSAPGQGSTFRFFLPALDTAIKPRNCD